MYYHTRGDVAVYGTIFRDSTNLSSGNGFFYHFDPSNSADENRIPASMQVLDSPSTTSQTTYQVYIHSGNGSQTVKMTPSNLRNSIIAMEIGA